MTLTVNINLKLTYFEVRKSPQGQADRQDGNWQITEEPHNSVVEYRLEIDIVRTCGQGTIAPGDKPGFLFPCSSPELNEQFGESNHVTG